MDERNPRLTFLEDRVWAKLGYLFCEVSFLWGEHGPSSMFWVFQWSSSLGYWFYGLAYDRFDREQAQRAPERRYWRYKERNGEYVG